MQRPRVILGPRVELFRDMDLAEIFPVDTFRSGTEGLTNEATGFKNYDAFSLLKESLMSW